MNEATCRWKAVVFDCDGVIIDSFEKVDETLQAICGVAYEPGITIKQIFKGNPWTFLENNHGIKPKEMLDQLEPKYGATEIFEDVADAILELATIKEPPRILILTANRKSIVCERLKKKDSRLRIIINQLEVWGDDEPEQLGSEVGKAEKLRHFVEQECKIDPYECCFVGDTSSDIAAGNAANVHTMGVYWGGFQPQQMLSAAHETLRSPNELLSRLLVDGAVCERCSDLAAKT